MTKLMASTELSEYSEIRELAIRSLVTEEISRSRKKPLSTIRVVGSERRTGSQAEQCLRAVHAFPTGSLSLDRATGIGGWPRGRIVELYGKASTGKTTLGLKLLANLQTLGLKGAYFDSDHKLCQAWLQVCGVDISAHTWIQGDDYLDVIRTLIETVESGEYAAVVVDTLAAAPIPDDFDHYGPEERHLVKIEQIIDRAISRLATAARRTNTCLLLLNQVRVDHDVLFGNPLRSVGGLSLDHACSLRAELSRVEPIKPHSSSVIGHVARVTMTKNLLAAPFSQASIPITHRFGVDELYERVCLNQHGRKDDLLEQWLRERDTLHGLRSYLQLADEYALDRNKVDVPR